MEKIFKHTQLIYGLIFQFLPTIISLGVINQLSIIENRYYLIYLVSFGFVNLFLEYSFLNFSPFAVKKFGVYLYNIKLVASILLIRLFCFLIICIFLIAYLWNNNFNIQYVSIIILSVFFSTFTPLVMGFVFNQLKKYYLRSLLARSIQIVFLFFLLFLDCFTFFNVMISVTLYYLVFIILNFKFLRFVFVKRIIHASSDVSNLKRILKLGLPFFQGNLITSCYTIFLPLFLPFILKGTELTNLLIAEKSVRPLSYLQIPLQQKTYLDLSVGMKEGRSNRKMFLVKYIILYFILFLPFPIIFHFCGDFILKFFFNKQVNEIILNNAKLISYVIPVIAVSNVVGLQILPLMNKVKIVNLCLLINSLIAFCLYFYLGKNYGSHGGAWATLLSESAITIMLLTIFIYFIYGRTGRNRL